MSATAGCPDCRFDAADYTDDDLRGTLRALAPVWRTMTEGVGAQLITAAPASGEPSVHDHALRVLVAVDAPSTAVDLGECITAIDKAAARMLRAPRAALEPAVHAGVHHQRAAARALHTLGAGAPTQHGHVVQVSASGGGVPKTALPSAVVGPRGIEGDVQAERLHHGKPMQALSLWSDDVIRTLRGEGHSVRAGAAGENLTVSGIDWTTIRPGVRIALGEVLVEISAYATPCRKNAQWFADGNFRRIDHNLRPGSSRAYAWVCRGGPVEPGARVVVEPGGRDD